MDSFSGATGFCSLLHKAIGFARIRQKVADGVPLLERAEIKPGDLAPGGVLDSGVVAEAAGAALRGGHTGAAGFARTLLQVRRPDRPDPEDPACGAGVVVWAHL